MINYLDCKDNIFFLTALFFSCLMGIGGMEAPEFRESEKQNRTAMYFFVQAGGKGNSIAGGGILITKAGCYRCSSMFEKPLVIRGSGLQQEIAVEIGNSALVNLPGNIFPGVIQLYDLR